MTNYKWPKHLSVVDELNRGGLALWADAGPNARALFIRLACDGDLRLVQNPSVARKLPIAQALEVLK